MSNQCPEKTGLFADDEWITPCLDRNWSVHDLLDQQCLFYLDQVTDVLQLDAQDLIKRAETCKRAGKNPWQVMGLRFVFDRWVVRMTVFAPYYRRTFATGNDRQAC